jgi:N6-adenosine-specific RNA methylase IME4
MTQKYRTIVADPPWSYDRSGSRGGVARHYSTMSVEQLLALPVREHAADDAHLYLWVTNLKLREGRPFDVMEAWGFRYMTMLTWHKVGGARGIGLGYYFRGETEHVLFGVRGRAPINPAIRERNHFAAARTPHSAKPDRFYEMVERVSPEPRLELFARRRRFGWDVLGNEAPELAASQAEMGLSA